MMKIVDLRVECPTRWAPPGWRNVLGQVGVRLETSEGITGYGVSGGGAATQAIVNHLLRDVLVGREIDDPGQIWQELYFETLAYGRSGLAIMAISGVDLAIWDCLARQEEVPMVDYLGGARRERIPGYITAPDEIPEELPSGVVGVKLAIPRGQDPRNALLRLREARTILGPEAGLMVDVGMHWDLAESLQFAEEASELNLSWFEEPLPADDIDGYVQLREASPIPIAGGEHDYTTGGFRRILEAGGLDIVQPDITWCGGMTTLLQVYEIAQECGVTVCPHRGGDAWGLPVIAARGDYALAEEARQWIPELNGSLAMDAEGYAVSNDPGFGVEMTHLNWED